MLLLDVVWSSRRWRLVPLALLCALSLTAGALVMAQEAASRTVWDGVYTDAQAERAVPVFNQSCASCHSLSADGRSPLSGAGFWDSYAQTSLSDLLTYVKATMPNGRGGSLSAGSYNDLVALILRANGVSAGHVELAPEAIADVRIVPRDGSQVLPANALVKVVGCLARQGSDWVLTHAAAPERVAKSGAVPGDAQRPLGDRTMALKFVLTRLDAFVGRRMSVSGLLMGAGGADGLNVTLVERVAESCP
jgi:quinoprotein glucose dehydrogenase